MFEQVSSKYLDVSRYHSQKLINKDPSLKSIIYKPKKNSRNNHL